jgi:hypothetical protein
MRKKLPVELFVENARSVAEFWEPEKESLLETLATTAAPTGHFRLRKKWKAAGLYLAIMSNTDHQFTDQNSDIIDHEKYKELRGFVIAHTKEESVERIKTYLSSLKKQRYRKKIAEDSVITHV